MPDILATLVSGLNGEDTCWKPSPQRWCVIEVLGHLVHVERFGFRERTERILNEEDPQFENYDPDTYAAAGAYAQPDLATALAAFGNERETSLAVLRAIAAEALPRTGRHAALGAVTLGNLLNEWIFHDLGHLRQIAELVRARKFYPHMGAWQRFYSVNP